MKIAYNPEATALTAAPSNNDITFDLAGKAIYARGVKFEGTNTTYSVFKKHTSDNSGGYDGLVPVPSYTTTTIRYLREDGNWEVPIMSEAVTDLGTEGNHITWTKNNIVNKLTVPYATSAGALEGYTISNFMVYADYSEYVAASFTDENLSKKATEKYIEYWDSAGWFNSAWGQVTANYGFVGNLTGTASYATSAGNANTANYINYTSRADKGNGTAQFCQYSGETNNPTNDWYSHIIMNHNNSAGYYTEIAPCFHSDSVYFRRQSNGTTYAWKKFAWTSDIPTVSNSNGYVPRFVSFPAYSHFGSSTDTYDYLKNIVKWIYDNANYGSKTYLMGVGNPNSLGMMNIQLYGTDGKNSEGYPRYCSGTFLNLGDSSFEIFGTVDYNYYRYRLSVDGHGHRITKLHRRDYSDDYSLQHHWTGSYWYLRGYLGDSYHAGVQVEYANSAGNADTVDGYHASSLWRSDGATWNPTANITMTPASNGQEWSFDFRSKGSYTGSYWHVWDESKSTLLKVDADSGAVSAPYGFVGNLSGNASSASTVTVNNSDANSTYRMVWHSGNTLYSTGGIYCNPSTDYLYATSMNASDWFRSSGNTGWYNESYGGGWYMTDSTWIRNYNSKQTYLSVSTYPSLVCNAQSGDDTNIRFDIAGSAKGYVGYLNYYGTFLYNCASAKRVYIADNGCFYTQSYINVGAGNEKNASNPPYVWGVNGSDSFMRTYATSSLSVGLSSSLYTASISGTSHANALSSYFSSSKNSIPRNKTLSLYSSAYGNGSQYMGYFLSGYDDTPYGGFFVAHYNNCYYVGISYGNYSEQQIITSSNIGYQSVNYANSAGNADTLDGYHWLSFVTAGVCDSGNFNTFYNRSFVGSIYATSNSPTGSALWFNTVQIAHRNGESDGSGYISQIAIDMTGSKNRMWFRGSRTDAWTEVISSANIGSQSVNYATSSGNANTVDNYHIWAGRSSSLPASRNNNTIYLVY